MSNQNRSVYVIGHKNPDTDSICSAVSYTALKNKLNNGGYKAKRAGHVSPETQFVLDYFKVEAPEYLSDVKLRVRDIEIREYEGVESHLSIKRAWEMMGDLNIVTIPIVHDKHLKGLITLGDITKAYMNVFDNEMIGHANTPYRNIVETLDGDMVVGEIEENINSGKVLIAAANPDLMENYIEQGDIVILGNRYESQLCAIEMNAQCIIVCEGALVSKTIVKLAAANNCTIIRTPYDTYTVARLINQSMPIGHFMRKSGLVSFTKEDYIEDIRDIMAKKRYRDFPVLDKEGNFCGMISRRNLLDGKRRKLIMVDHNEKSQAVDGLEDADIQEVIDHHRIGSLETINPVYFRNQPVGCTSTIVYQLYQENNVEIEPSIAGLMCSAILSDTLVFRSPTCTAVDKAAAEHLAKIAGIEIEEYAIKMFKAGSNVLDKTPEEIFYQDYKQFTAGELVFGVGQITAMTQDELDEIKVKLMPYIVEVQKEKAIPMIFFMLTNIIEESTELLYIGEGAFGVVKNAFSLGDEAASRVYLEGVVSRKKQLIPALVKTLQENN
ncbi:MAG: putative manganese-dependent inorganic diphosphatase [bacterium]|nr:putative manganese-dependent inorganic diphosphatase [bacterium]